MEKSRPQPVRKWDTVVIAGFHLAGLTGLLAEQTRPPFLSMVPFSLLALLMLLIYINRGNLRSFLIFTLGVFIVSFLAEVLAVHADVFGKYKFGETLGFQLAAVPLMMGVYFVLLIYSIGQFVYNFPLRNVYARAFSGSILLLIFNYFLEPAASKFNYWKWDSDAVPYQSHIAWLVIGFILLQFFYAMHLTVRKQTGSALFLSQLLLFIVLYFAVL